MSQPPSLPKLAAFLRSGQPQPQPQPQQQPQQPHQPHPEKRRLEHGGPPQAAPHAPMYAHDDSELHRHKRRANLFVQYGEPDFRAQPQPQPHHHQQVQPQQPQQRAGFDRQHSFQSPNAQPVSPYGTHARGPPPPLPPPLGDRHMRHPAQGAFRDYPAGPAAGLMTARTQPSPRGNAPPDARRVLAVKTQPPQASGPAPVPEPIQRERKSRYLSESDRRSIIARIDQGEKQVALAKEYQVSRAAICNLYKNRRDVLTRADRDPTLSKAKSTPKRSKDAGAAGTGSEEKQEPGESRGVSAASSGAEEKDTSDDLPVDEDAMSDENSSTESVDTEPQTSSGRSPGGAASASTASRVTTPTAPPLRVYNASASSYPIRRLVGILRNAQLPQTTLRRVMKRLVSCLLEEVLVCLPRRDLTATSSTGDACAGVEPIQDEQICAVSMEEHGSMMLQTLLDMFPSAATALVFTTRRESAFGDQWTATCARPPRVQSGSATSVVVLASACATGARVAAVLDFLVNVVRVSPTSIYVATLIGSQPGVARVNQQFPGVTIVSAAIDDGLDEQARIRPGLGDLLDRFWHQAAR